VVQCLPSKNAIHSAKIVEVVRHASTFGLRLGPWTVDMAGVRQRKRELVDGMIAIHKARFAADGLEFILGDGRFLGPKTIEVRLAQGGTRRLEGERVFLNLGTHAAIPDIRGLSGAAPLTHVEVLELDRIPTHLIVLGGYVGLEMAEAFRRFGSRVSGTPHTGKRHDNIKARFSNRNRSSAARRLFADLGEAPAKRNKRSGRPAHCARNW